MTQLAESILKYAYKVWLKTHNSECSLLLHNANFYFDCNEIIPFLDQEGYIERIEDSFDDDKILVTPTFFDDGSSDLLAIFSITDKGINYVKRNLLS